MPDSPWGQAAGRCHIPANQKYPTYAVLTQRRTPARRLRVVQASECQDLQLLEYEQPADAPLAD